MTPQVDRFQMVALLILSPTNYKTVKPAGRIGEETKSVENVPPGFFSRIYEANHVLYSKYKNMTYLSLLTERASHTDK